MEQLTVGDVASFLALVAGVIGSLTVIMKFFAGRATKWLRRALKPLEDKVDGVGHQIKAESVERCKDFVVRTLADVENGEKVTKEELQRFYENYERYTQAGGNGYIKKQVEVLTKSGKL